MVLSCNPRVLSVVQKREPRRCGHGVNNCNSSGRAAVTSQIPPWRKMEPYSNPEKRIVNLKRKIPDESEVDVCPRKMARFAPVGLKLNSALKNMLMLKSRMVKRFTRSQTRATYQPPITVEQQRKERICNYWIPSLETIQELDEEMVINDESRRSSIRIDMPRCKDSSNSFENSTARKFFWGSLVVFLIIMIVSFTILPHYIGLSRKGLAEKQALAEKSISTFTSYTTNQKTAEEKI